MAFYERGKKDGEIETAARLKIVLVFWRKVCELLTLTKKALNWICSKHHLSRQEFNWWDRVSD